MFENFIYGLILIFHRTFNIQSIKYQAFFPFKTSQTSFRYAAFSLIINRILRLAQKRTFDFNAVDTIRINHYTDFWKLRLARAHLKILEWSR